MKSPGPRRAEGGEAQSRGAGLSQEPGSRAKQAPAGLASGVSDASRASWRGGHSCAGPPAQRPQGRVLEHLPSEAGPWTSHSDSHIQVPATQSPPRLPSHSESRPRPLFCPARPCAVSLGHVPQPLRPPQHCSFRSSPSTGRAEARHRAFALTHSQLPHLLQNLAEILTGSPGGSAGEPSSAGDVRDSCSIPGAGRSPGGGRAQQPLQSPCLENPTDRGAWWVTPAGSQSRTCLGNVAAHSGLPT